jgi:serine/threonine-protein kinase
MRSKGDVVGGRYRILGELGRGGMGVVYRAEHVPLRRQVALKLLDSVWSGTDMERRFEREARLASRLDHPGCVRVLDHGRTIDGQLFLAMELLEGPTLAEWLRASGPMGVDVVLAVARELLETLAYAHGEGVLHRDVKPENVMIARRGRGTRLMLIDFGLARLRDDAGITQQGTCVGSPSYVAPERLLGEGGDERSDLYSAAIVLWELLTGVKPFGQGSAMEIAVRHVVDPAPALRSLRADAPAALEAVLDTAMAKDPAGRFTSALEMLAAVAAAGRAAEAVPVLVPRARPRARTAPPPPPPPEEAVCTLPLYKLAEEPAWKRAVAWARHGAWRWRLA